MDGEMGEDLLAEILVRLPHKSLARFQCVSTTWRGLISADYLRRRLPLITSGVLFNDGPRDGEGGRRAYTYARALSSAGEDGGEGGGVAEADDMAFFPCHATSSTCCCRGCCCCSPPPLIASSPPASDATSPRTPPPPQPQLTAPDRVLIHLWRLFEKSLHMARHMVPVRL